MAGTSPELSHVKDPVMSKGTVKTHRNTDSYEQSYHKNPQKYRLYITILFWQSDLYEITQIIYNG
jgi:hypothetical protein